MNDFNSIRYTGDDPYLFGLTEEEFVADKGETVRKDLLSNSLRVTSEMFPEINTMIDKVLNNLEINNYVETYIKSDPQPQAMCIAQLNSVDFIIVITSSLLELLSPSELSFIIGHEIGHYVFKHYEYPRPIHNENQIQKFNKLQLSRAAEISADRMGLLSAIPDKNKSNIEVAVSSMIKVVSGVSDRYFKLNISSYLKQGRDLVQLSGNSDAIYSTHPVFPDRVPALMQFEISQPYYKFIKSEKYSSLDKGKLDSSIDNQIKSHSGNALEDHIKDLASGFTIWSTMMLIHLDGEFSKKEHAAMSYLFDEETAEELKKFYSHTPETEQENFIHDMVKQELKKLDGLNLNDKEDILYNIERLASVCDGDIDEIKKRLVFIARLLEIDRSVEIRSLNFSV